MFKYLLAFVLAGSMAFSSVSATAADQKIGAISVPYILQKIPQTKAAEAKVKKAIDSKVKALDKLQNDAQALYTKLNNPSATPEQRNKIQGDLQILMAEIKVKENELISERNKLLQKENQTIMKLIEKALEQVAKQQNVDVVFKAEAIAYTSTQKIDLSDAVIEVVSKSK
jgi:outer membrane protein